MPRLQARPLAEWEHEGLKAALRGAGLPTSDVDDHATCTGALKPSRTHPGRISAALRSAGHDALLRSIVTLPQLRHLGIGRAIVAKLGSRRAPRLRHDLSFERHGGGLLCEPRLRAVSARRIASRRPRSGSSPRRSVHLSPCWSAQSVTHDGQPNSRSRRPLFPQQGVKADMAGGPSSANGRHSVATESSITSSARPRSGRETVRPSAWRS